MGQSKFIISLILIAVFTIAIVTYSFGFASDNNAVTDISDDPEISGLKTNLETEAGTTYSVYNSTDQSWKIEEVETDADYLKKAGTFKTMSTTPRKSFDYILTTTKVKIFGNDPSLSLVLNIFMGVIVILGILYFWKTVKGGNPD